MKSRKSKDENSHLNYFFGPCSGPTQYVDRLTSNLRETVFDAAITNVIKFSDRQRRTRKRTRKNPRKRKFTNIRTEFWKTKIFLPLNKNVNYLVSWDSNKFATFDRVRLCYEVFHSKFPVFIYGFSWRCFKTPNIINLADISRYEE